MAAERPSGESGHLRAATVARLCAHRRRRLWSELWGSLSAEEASKEDTDPPGRFGELVRALRIELEAVREEVGTPGSLQVLAPGSVDDEQVALGSLLGSELVRSLANVADHLAVELNGEGGVVTIGLRASGCRRLPESVAELARDLTAGDVDLRWEAGAEVVLPAGVHRVFPELPGRDAAIPDGDPSSGGPISEPTGESPMEPTAGPDLRRPPAASMGERAADELWVCGTVAPAGVGPTAPGSAAVSGPGRAEGA